MQISLLIDPGCWTKLLAQRWISKVVTKQEITGVELLYPFTLRSSAKEAWFAFPWALLSRQDCSNSWLMVLMILVSVGFIWLNLFFSLKVFSLQFWAGWSLLPARRYSWFLWSCLCSLCSMLSWLKAQTAAAPPPGELRTPRKTSPAWGCLWCGEQAGGDREQPLALLKLQLWGWEWEQAAPEVPWAVSQGLDTCEQCYKSPVDSGLGDSRVVGAV